MEVLYFLSESREGTAQKALLRKCPWSFSDVDVTQ